VDSCGRTIWIADAHRDDDRRTEKLNKEEREKQERECKEVVQAGEGLSRSATP
jgi:hypothetical protein